MSVPPRWWTKVSGSRRPTWTFQQY